MILMAMIQKEEENKVENKRQQEFGDNNTDDEKRMSLLDLTSFGAKDW